MASVTDKLKSALSKSPPPNDKKTATAEQPPGRAARETIESVVIAIILAFLFRTFEAEAFVIPTGSMAPTLQGAHRDVACPQCGYRYRTGASHESNPSPFHDGVEVVGGVCPICRFPQVFDPEHNANEKTFTGDRILVSKFAYQTGDPERWDPLVFKFPGNPKQNYIKRLVGLPGEKGRIFHGDVFVVPPGETQEQILRKPPHKLVAMLQLIDDTDHIAPALLEAGWPSRWQKWAPPTSQNPAAWTMSKDQSSFTTDGQGDLSWIRYQHLAPFESDWATIVQGRLPLDLPERRGMLITDFYTYNQFYTLSGRHYDHIKGLPRDEFEREVRTQATSSHGPKMNSDTPTVLGKHWVGDLALECTATVTGTSGQLLLNLVEGGTHYTCRIDVATGIAKFDIDQGATAFVDATGKETPFPEAQTEVKGPGEYRLRLSNCDDEMLLWVNDKVVKFNGPTTYATRPDASPRQTADDPGDMAPAGIGTDGAAFSVRSLRILRDVYYIASNGGDEDYEYQESQADLTAIFTNPDLWNTTKLFEQRESVDFALEADQYFPLGDNSPQSMDARSWSNRHVPGFEIPRYVDRKLLIGKALLIYWPHAWNSPVPFTPNVQRMGVIR